MKKQLQKQGKLKMPKILVVDKDKDVLESAKKILSSKGYKVFSEQDEKTAVKKLVKENVDVIIFDAETPDVDNISMLAKVKKLLPQVEVIITAKQTKTTLFSNFVTDLVFSFLRKPFDPTELISLVNKAYERKMFIKKIFDLEQIDKHKDELLSFVSHELKTPIMVITNAVDLILEKIDSAKTEKDIEKCKQNTKMMLEMVTRQLHRIKTNVENLLDYTRIEVGTIKIVKQKVSVLELFKEVISEAEYLIRQKKLEFSYPQNLKDVEIEIDKEEIKKVLLNLITNAVKFTAEGGKIYVYYKVLKDKIEFGVEDTGIGIEKKELPKIFERFYRVEQPEKIEGLGLGLAICKKIVELHNGKIWAESEGIGKGSKFKFYLPLKNKAKFSGVGGRGVKLNGFL
jgi:signal transduction histidine kinase